MNTPSELVRAFVAALDAEDAPALEALCTPTGWTQGGDSIGRFVRQTARRPLRYLPLAEVVEGDSRAAICGLLSDRGSSRQHGRLWLHAVKQGKWRLEGTHKHDRAAALFVSGVLPAIFDATALPVSPSAASWAEQVLVDAESGPEALAAHGPIVARGFETIADDTEGVLAAIGTHRVEAIGRHVAGFGRRHGPDDVRMRVWFALEDEAPSGDLRVVGHSFGPGSALLLSEPAG